MFNISRRVVLLLPLGCFLVMWFYIFNGHKINRQRRTERYEMMNKYDKDSVETGTWKKILFWNEAYGNKNYGIGIGKDVFRRASCPVWQCETTDNRWLYPVQDFDAILFHLRSWRRRDVPKRRYHHQRYIFWSIESPAFRYVNTNRMKQFFNWTMTYRWDSDVIQSYGWIEVNSSVPLHPTADELDRYKLETKSRSVNYAAGKDRIAAWFVSNCNSLSDRSAFVKKLQQYMHVDIYGACGRLKCPRSKEQYCREMVQQKYKFYLSLENSLCLDYITEKFYNMMNYNVVPIVMSLHGSHAKMAPPHSYINAAAFPTVKELAQYLIMLDKNDTLYNEYFWWKPYFNVRNNEDDFNKGMCNLCAALHRNHSAKVYNDMTKWWDTNSNCSQLKLV